MKEPIPRRTQVLPLRATIEYKFVVVFVAFVGIPFDRNICSVENCHILQVENFQKAISTAGQAFCSTLMSGGWGQHPERDKWIGQQEDWCCDCVVRRDKYERISRWSNGPSDGPRLMVETGGCVDCLFALFRFILVWSTWMLRSSVDGMGDSFRANEQ